MVQSFGRISTVGTVMSWLSILSNTIWDTVFKGGLSKLCGRQPSKILKGYVLLKQIISLPSNFLIAVFHKIYLVHSWILFLIWLRPFTVAFSANTCSALFGNWSLDREKNLDFQMVSTSSSQFSWRIDLN